MKPWMVGLGVFLLVGLVLIDFTQAAGLIGLVAGFVAYEVQRRRLLA